MYFGGDIESPALPTLLLCVLGQGITSQYPSQDIGNEFLP